MWVPLKNVVLSEIMNPIRSKKKLKIKTPPLWMILATHN